jgi:hypothetical protein
MEASDAMTTDTWHSRAVPILEAVRDVEGMEEAYGLQIGYLAERTGLDPNHVAVEVERLIEGGYLAGTLAKPMSGGDVRPWRVSSARLAPTGARAVGLWPPSDPYQALLALLERRVAEAPDEETRSKWRKVRDTILGLGKDVGTNLIANVLVELSRGGL